jgi:nucleolar MIF4G domain-containing protein 1
MHCCLQERVYNPYYAYLAQRFCEYAYSFKITLQYTLWDIFKSVEEDDDSFQGIDGVRKISNLGRFFLHLVIHKAVPISILKSLTFTSLSKLNSLFCQIVVGGVLCHSSSKSQKLIKEIFMRMKDTSTEAKEGLLFYISQYLSPEKLERVLKPISKTDIRLLSLQLPIARTILEGGRLI